MNPTNYDRQWYSTLNKDNAEAFAARLKALLAGQRYTFIAVNEMFGTRAEVRVNQALEGHSVRPGHDNVPPSRETFPIGDPNNISVTIGADFSADYVHVMGCDTYGVWSVSQGTYFVFTPESRYEPNKVTLNFKAGAGNDITWTFYPTGPIVPEVE